MRCRMCGCTDYDACFDPGLGITCSWYDDDLCTFCVAIAIDRQLPPEPPALVTIYSDAQAADCLHANNSHARRILN